MIGGLLIIVGCLSATMGLDSVVSFLTDNVLGDKGFLP